MTYPATRLPRNIRVLIVVSQRLVVLVVYLAVLPMGL
jgi:hypothetical protein